MQVWSKSIHWFKRYRVRKKLRGRGRRRGRRRRRRRRRRLEPHQKQYVHWFPPPNNALVQVCSKSIHLFRRYRVRKPNLISFHGLVTLKMRSRSPKSNQLFPPSQPCIYASLVKIHPLVQKISRKKEATRTRTPTRTPTPTPTPTPTGTAPKTICPPPSVGGT